MDKDVFGNLLDPWYGEGCISYHAENFYLSYDVYTPAAADLLYSIFTSSGGTRHIKTVDGLPVAQTTCPAADLLHNLRENLLHWEPIQREKPTAPPAVSSEGLQHWAYNGEDFV